MERRQAIISVFDKEGVVAFCKRVSSHFDFISTGNTAKLLESSDIPVTRVSDFTGYPEILGGRVKTLHPKVMGGILGTKQHQSEIEKMDLQPFGLVVSNLYPFEQVISQKHDLMVAIENIDIGGVTLLRAAAKNYHEVLVVSSPSDYERVAAAILDDSVTEELRKDLAIKAFKHTAKYDIAISRYLSSEVDWPPSFVMGFDNPQDLRYGENWHQEAKYYLAPGSEPFYTQVHGKQVSFNNLVDFTSAIGVLSEFEDPTCAIIKHTSPCGVACSGEIEAAFDDAFATDNLSAFGSVMGFNRPITEPLAKKLNAMFVDAIIAPEYDLNAMEILTKKKNLILCTFNDYTIPDLAIRLVPNGILVQPSDTHKISKSDLKVVSERSPTDEEFTELMFAWKVVKYTKSNAAVISTRTKTLGVGMGQTSRVGAVELALKRAGERSKGAVLASDAFFPYRDSIDAAVKEGVSAIIAPGGSIRDNQSITAADEAGISLVWSGIRAFLH
ncbi:MAG: bifunctional phosphoribosylaminoimidazolecarboxamide formyltransferase/IMP cyclohydrolase [Candidatus Thorarchaeota archaeon]